MEESSESRRERLRAMRAVATEEAPPQPSTSTTTSGLLANPLVDVQQPEERSLFASPRFDFYTDPMAAFSANRKRNPTPHFTPSSNTPFPGPRNPQATPYSGQQMPSQYPNPRVYQAQDPHHHSFAPSGNPRDMTRPFPINQGHPPQAWSRPGGTGNYASPPPYRGIDHSHPMNPGSGPLESPSLNYGRGRGHWRGSNPSPSSAHGGIPTSNAGRGRGQWHGGNMNQGFGRSGGRGRGFWSPSYSQDEAIGPEKFYDKSMVEDPWRNLEPVLWKELPASLNNSNIPGSVSYWLSKSTTLKRPRVAEPSDKSSSQPSLAEYLAASFSETVNDASSV